MTNQKELDEEKILGRVIIFGLLIVVLVLLFVCSGCSVGHKSWGTANSADAFKVSISDPQSGNITYAYAP